ncbi:exportin-4 [Clonorchis sinensis]|uniref:Exportin-4 n=1 Tax=Clonorchis sinensis TaxID=79923 RepID=G7YCS6_CLOSI|nr:exportin-4 [Clonorchis sinensis]
MKWRLQSLNQIPKVGSEEAKAGYGSCGNQQSVDSFDTTLLSIYEYNTGLRLRVAIRFFSEQRLYFEWSGMDGVNFLIAELEEAALLQLNARTADQRKLAEERILQFRSQAQPYDLCCTIMSWTTCLIFMDITSTRMSSLYRYLRSGTACMASRDQSSNDYLLYEAGRCLSHAVVREWDTVFASATGESVNPKANQLLSFLLKWAEQRGTQAEASQRCLLGLCILCALLDELSNSEDSTQVNLVLEAHIFLRARFQDHELLRLFHSLLWLIDRLLQHWAHVPLSSLNAEHNEIIFRIVCCMDSIMSWDFLPRELVGFYAARPRRSDHESCFRPSAKWSSVFGSEALPSTILLLIKLHTFTRSSDILGTRTLCCLSRLSAMTGPLTDPVTNLSELSEIGSNQTTTWEDYGLVSSSACRFHILTCMDNLNFWLIDASDDISNTSSVLSAFPPEQQSLFTQECSKCLANPLYIPHLPLDQLSPYELPILSELTQNIVLRISRAWEPVRVALSLPSSLAAGCRLNSDPQSIFQYAIMALVVLDRFFIRMYTLIVQCLQFMAQYSPDPDGSEKSAHEAVERLFNGWIDLVESIPSVGRSFTIDGNFSQSDCLGTCAASHLPVPLTTGNLKEQEGQAHQIRTLLHAMESNIGQLRIRLFQSYLLSKLGAPVGLRRSTQESEEDIDLELDECDMIASEDSLFACGACGLAAPEDSTKLLLQLLDDRTEKLIRSHSQVLHQPLDDLYEDLHWILLVTGHFIVSGPASLASIQRSGTTWDTEFSVPYPLLRVNKDDAVDIQMSCRLLCASASEVPNSEHWPPSAISVDRVPILIRLLASLYRLLWLQTNLGIGSALLIQDNLWLMTRFVVAYICQNPVDPEALTENKNTFPILTILQTTTPTPKAAHFGQTTSGLLPTDANRENHTSAAPDVSRVCIQGLLSCAWFALNKWSSEPQVLSSAICLIRALGRHAPNTSSNLVCPAWYEICALFCGSDSANPVWSNITPDSLTELTEACLCGSWAIDKERLSPNLANRSTSSGSEPLLLQLVHSLRERLINVLAPFCHPSSTVDSLTTDGLIRCLATLRGLARAVGALAAQSEAATDLISLVWTSVLYPALENCSNLLIPRFHNCSEIVQSVVSLFSDVADSCLIYLANVPSSVAERHLPTPLGDRPSSGNTANSSRKTSASSNYLNLTATLCRHYAKQNTNKSSFEATAEDERIAELRLLLTMLSRISAHEFEVRLSGALLLPLEDDGPLTHTDEWSSKSVGTVYVSLIGMGHLLPLITESILMVPEVCHAFYSLASFACDLHIIGLNHMSDEQLAYFGRLIRHGILGIAADAFPSSTPGWPFSGVDSSVIRQCLEIIIALTEFCQDARCNQQAKAEQEIADRFCKVLGLNTQLLIDVFALLTQDSYSTDIETVLSSTVLGLIHMNLDAYADLVEQWLNSCQDVGLRDRLRIAFERLGSPNQSASTDERTNRYTAGFSNRKPTRIAQIEFQQKFHSFVGEIRAFLCHT